MKTLYDPVSKHKVDINYLASVGVATMSANGNFIAEKVPKGSQSMAQFCYTLGDLEKFGSFCNA